MDEIDGCFSETLGRSIVMDIETSIETPASRAAPQSSDGGDLLDGRGNVGWQATWCTPKALVVIVQQPGI